MREQYEKYPYPAYNEKEAFTTANWLREHRLHADSVIDVGCGTGLWSVAFALMGADVTAVDFSSSSLETAKKMADRFGVSIEFHHADLFVFKTSKRFELVFCNGVLHHTNNARAGFHNVSSLADRSGRLVTSFYNRLSPFRLAKVLVRVLGGNDLETKRRVAAALVNFPLLPEFLSHMGQTQPGPSSSIRDYVSRDENLVDLLCHAHTSYHTLWEIRRWYADEGFTSLATFPTGTGLSSVIPNLIFYYGIRKP